MKHKKFSSAILCGFKKVDGRQYFGDFSNERGLSSSRLAVCVLGAGNLCLTGDPSNHGQEAHRFEFAFKEAWGVFPQDLNDDEGMPWEHIYGMARAAGL